MAYIPVDPNEIEPVGIPNEIEPVGILNILKGRDCQDKKPIENNYYVIG